MSPKKKQYQRYKKQDKTVETNKNEEPERKVEDGDQQTPICCKENDVIVETDMTDYPHSISQTYSVNYPLNNWVYITVPVQHMIYTVPPRSAMNPPPRFIHNNEAMHAQPPIAPPGHIYPMPPPGTIYPMPPPGLYPIPPPGPLYPIPPPGFPYDPCPIPPPGVPYDSCGACPIPPPGVPYDSCGPCPIPPPRVPYDSCGPCPIPPPGVPYDSCGLCPIPPPGVPYDSCGPCPIPHPGVPYDSCGPCPIPPPGFPYDPCDPGPIPPPGFPYDPCDPGPIPPPGFPYDPCDPGPIPPPGFPYDPCAPCPIPPPDFPYDPCTCPYPPINMPPLPFEENGVDVSDDENEIELTESLFEYIMNLDSDYFLNLSKEYFPTPASLDLDPNPIIDAFCEIPIDLEDISWILDLELGVPKQPVTRPIATYFLNNNGVRCKDTPETIHPSFDSCPPEFQKILSLYYEYIFTTWYRGFSALFDDCFVLNFDRWMEQPLNDFGMCWR